MVKSCTEIERKQLGLNKECVYMVLKKKGYSGGPFEISAGGRLRWQMREVD